VDQGSPLLAQPWAIELAVPGVGPVRCLFITGVSGFVGGERIMYDCTAAGVAAGYVVGEVSAKSGSPWQVFYSSAISAEVVRVPVRTVWK